MDIQRKKVAVIGASGLIGKAVCARLGLSYDLIVFRRQKGNPPLGSTHHTTQVYSSLQELTRRLSATDCDVIINLAGEPVAGKRWSSGQKQKIRDSRILTTRAITESFQHRTKKPQTLINASAIGFYGDTGEQAADEATSPGDDFLSRVCADWESEAMNARQPGVRVVLLRLGMVLGNGGALKKMKLPFQWFAGGPVGSGRQWLSWIHIDDVSRIIETCLQNGEMEGPVNCVSPEPLRMADFAKTIGKTLHRPSFLRIPAWVIRVLWGESASLVLASQKIKPAKLDALRFPFLFRTADSALNNLLAEKR